MGNIFVIIGGAHQGKSYWVKQQIQDPETSCFVYDYQDSYGPTSKKPNDIILNLPIGTREKRCRWYGEETQFIEHANIRMNTNIIIEEATIFFEGRTQKPMRKLMVDRFHNKNNIFIIFHSINAVPPRIMEMANIVVLFKTGDDPDTIKRKYSKYVAPFHELEGKPDRTKLILKNI